MNFAHLVLHVFATFAGTSAFIAFLILQYYAGAVFAFIAAAFSAVNSHITWLHHRHRLNLWYDHREMSQFYWLGFVTFALSFSGFVYFFVAYLVLHDYTARLDLVIGCIWGIIAAKSGAILMFYAHRFTGEGVEMNLIVDDSAGSGISA